MIRLWTDVTNQSDVYKAKHAAILTIRKLITNKISTYRSLYELWILEKINSDPRHWIFVIQEIKSFACTDLHIG